jgi:hypothetical protein
MAKIHKHHVQVCTHTHTHTHTHTNKKISLCPTPKTGDKVQQQKLLLVVGMQSWKTVWQGLARPTIKSRNNVPKSLSKWIENLWLNESLLINVWSSFIYYRHQYNCKGPRYPLISEWVNKRCYIHTMECCLAIKRNDLLSLKRYGGKLSIKFLLLNERKQFRKVTYWMILTMWHFGKGKTIVTVKRLEEEGEDE